MTLVEVFLVLGLSIKSQPHIPVFGIDELEKF